MQLVNDLILAIAILLVETKTYVFVGFVKATSMGPAGLAQKQACPLYKKSQSISKFCFLHSNQSSTHHLYSF